MAKPTTVEIKFATRVSLNCRKSFTLPITWATACDYRCGKSLNIYLPENLKMSKCIVGVAEASQPCSPSKQLSQIATQRREKELTPKQIDRFYRYVVHKSF